MKKSCPNCHSESPLYFQSNDYNRRVSQETFNHYRCSQCELIFIFPIPSNLTDYYPETYHCIPDSAEYLEAASIPERYKIELVQQFISSGRLLEIGPSYGTFTYLAKKAGFEVDAIEMDIMCCQFLDKVVGINSINSSDPISVLRQRKFYDVIVLWHVIEHLSEPWETLDAIFDGLKPGGIVVLAAPNPDSFQFKIMGRYWPHVDAPRHLMLIPLKLLVEKLEAKGMQKELVTTMDKGSIGWNTFGWEFFFTNLCSNSYIKRVLRVIGQFVGFLFGPIEGAEGKGSAYTIIFRKKI